MRRGIGWVLVNVVSLAVLAWLGAQVFNNVVRAEIVALPTQPSAVKIELPDRTREGPTADLEGEAISARNLFNSEPPELQPPDPDEDEEEKEPEVVGEEPPGPGEECPEAKGDAMLVATMVAHPEQHSRALVHEGRRRDEESRLVRPGQSIETGTVVAIHRQRLVLRGDDGFACLKLGEEVKRRSRRKTRRSRRRSHRRRSKKAWKEGIKKVGKNRYEIDRNMMEEQLNDMQALSKGVRMVPYSKGGRPAGFKMIRVRSNSIYFALGLRSRDILRGANGEEITTPNRALQLLDSLKTRRKVTIDVTRRGRPVTLEYEIK